MMKKIKNKSARDTRGIRNNYMSVRVNPMGIWGNRDVIKSLPGCF